MNCQDFLEKLIEPGNLAHMENDKDASAHIAVCSTCKARLAFEKKITEGFEYISSRQPPVVLANRILSIPESIPKTQSPDPVGEIPFWKKSWFQLGLSTAFAAAFVTIIWVGPSKFQHKEIVTQLDKSSIKNERLVLLPTSAPTPNTIKLSSDKKDLSHPSLQSQPSSIDDRPSKFEIAQLPHSSSETPLDGSDISTPISNSTVSGLDNTSRFAEPTESSAASPMKAEHLPGSVKSQATQPERFQIAKKSLDLDDTSSDFPGAVDQDGFAPESPNSNQTNLNPFLPKISSSNIPHPEIITSPPSESNVGGAKALPGIEDETKKSQKPAEKDGPFDLVKDNVRDEIPTGKTLLMKESENSFDATKTKATRNAEAFPQPMNQLLAMKSSDDSDRLATSSEQKEREKEREKEKEREENYASINFRNNRLQEIFTAHENEITEGPIDLSDWAVLGWISEKEKITLSPPVGSRWVIKRMVVHLKVVLEPIE